MSKSDTGDAPKAKTVTRYREPALLPVKTGMISDKDKTTLRRIGVVVIECDSPEELRLLRPQNELDANQMLHCAMQALISENYGTARDQRQKFARLMAAAIAANFTISEEQ